jgi:hypothetical protein
VQTGVLTNGKEGEDPNFPGLVVEPVDPEVGASKRCVICDMIDKERGRENNK